MDKHLTTAVNDLAGDLYRAGFVKINDTDAIRTGGYYLSHEEYRENQDLLNGIEGDDPEYLRTRQPTDSVVRVRYEERRQGKPKIELFLNGRSGMAVINANAALVSLKEKQKGEGIDESRK